MRTLDRIFAWILLLLGCMHGVGTFFVYKTLVIDAVWFFCGALAIIFGALFNLARISRPADRLMGGLAVLVNLILLAVFVAVVPWILRHDLKANPQVIVLAATLIVEFALSLRQWLR
jgi:hypothetical protein